MREEEKLRSIIESARSALRIEEERVEEFVECVNRYLREFEEWRGAQTDPEPTKHPQLVEELQSVHQAVVSRTDAYRGELKQQLVEIRRRAQGLRAYVDHLPQRVTITGKREG